MKRSFPATLDGLGAAVAYRYLYPYVEAVLSGKPDGLLEIFPQSGDFPFASGENEIEKCGSSVCLSCTAFFVMEMEKNGVSPSPRDANLFAAAIYSKTSALLDANTTAFDVRALFYCFAHGARLNEIPPRFRSPYDRELKASEVMTRSVRTVRDTTSVEEVLKTMNRTGLTGLPVIDSEERIVGMVTKKDAERALKSGVDDLKIVMSIPPITAKKDDSIRDVGELMTVYDIGRIVIVDSGMEVVGIITRRDLMRAIATSLGGPQITTDISGTMKRTVPPDLLSVLKEMGRFANDRKERFYIVGGFVRDLLLDKTSLDVDTVIEGNGIGFATAFSKKKKIKRHVHPEFRTATLFFDGISIDVATARTEYYEMPGALPKVEVSNLRKDLYRRDFTINAMAISANSESFGTLIDFFGGRRDIDGRKIRILHNMSFVEDPTRILRALRYAARFGYSLEKKTESLLLNAIKKGYLSSVSFSRIRAEFERTLEDESVAGAFELFQKYGVFGVFGCEEKTDFRRYFRIFGEFSGKVNGIRSLFLLLLRSCSEKTAFEIMKLYGMSRKLCETFEKMHDDGTLSILENPKSRSELYFTLSRIHPEAFPVLAYDERFEENVLYHYRQLSKIKLEKVGGSLLKEKYGLEGHEIKRVLLEVLRSKIDDGEDEMVALKKTVGDLK